METCNLKILSKGEGWQDSRSVDGEIDIDEGVFILRYSLDGDSCLLKFKNKKVEQFRKGSQTIHIEFEKGEFTECIIGDCELCGSYKIFTKSLDCKIFSKGFRLMLEYESGEDKENISLLLTAYIKEKR